MPITLYELVGQDEARPFSPHCWKVAFALAHKGLEFTSVPTPFTAIAGIEDGASRIVPVIRDGDRLVADSFEIALYLEETYPDRPSLFAGEGGKALSRFVERWCNTTLHAFIGPALLVDIHDRLDRPDQIYFRETREARLGRSLEESANGREGRLEGFRAALAPLRGMVEKQAFLGGDAPLFADYILAGALQWARVVSPFPLLDAQDPVALWFGRCLDLHGGLGRRVQAAA